MKNFFLKTGLTLLCLIIGLGSAWGEITPLSLPHSWNASDGKSSYTETLGCTLSGLGTDYSSAPKLKFDNSGDFLLIQVADAPDEISFNIKGNSVSGTYSFKVQESIDGISYTDALNITSVTSSSAQKTAQLNSSTRYIKLIYATKASGNMGIGGISITKGTGTTKTLSSIAVKTAPTKTTYTEGENFDPAGLVITGTYSDTSTEDIAYAGHESNFSFNPALTTALTTSNTSVTITYNGKTVNQPITVEQNQSGETTITFDDLGYTSWGKTAQFSGSTYNEVSQSKSDVTFTYTRNTGSLYANTSAIRFYKANELTFTAPDGYKITSISWIGSNFTNDVTTDVATCTSTTSVLSWSGNAASVTFTRPSSASSYITLSSVTVKLVKDGDTPTPTITAESTLSLPATESDDTFNVTWTNVEEYDATLYADAACTSKIEDCDWLIIELNSSQNIEYYASANTTTSPRTVYMQLYGVAADGTTDATKVVTITQAGATPVYASLAALVADGAPTATAKKVTVTLTNETITRKVSNGIFVQVGDKEIELYKTGLPSSWQVGGTISGTLTNCTWQDYKGTWELCPSSWDELSYTAPLPNLPNFIKNAVVTVYVGHTYNTTDYLNIPADYDCTPYTITTTINGLTEKDGEYACVYPNVAFQTTGTYTVHVLAPATDKYAQTEGDIEFTVINESVTYNITIDNTITNGTVTADPTTASEGETIALTVTPATGYTLGTLTVTNATTSAPITVTSNTFIMPAANVNVTATFEEEAAPGSYTYNLVTDASTLAAGDVIVLGSTLKRSGIETSVAAGPFNGEAYLSAVEASVTDGIITSAGAIELTIGGLTGAWTLATSNGTIGTTEAKKMNENGNGTTTWTISITDGNASITSTNSNYGTIKYNSNAPRFLNYTSGQTAIQIYKKTLSTPKTLTSISLDGQTTEFTEGDEFAFGGTVTAHYDNETTKNVTSSATFTGYDMNTTGEQTVTVSYTEGGVTKEASYTITVVSLPRYTVTIETPTNGTLVVKHGDDVVTSGEQFAVGEVLDVTATPAAGYKFRNWQAVDGTTHTFTSGTKWTMTASDVTIKANFDPADQNYLISWNVNGTVTNQQVDANSALVAPDMTGKTLGTREFVGWTEDALVKNDTIPTYVTLGTATKDVTYYAVFADREEVTAAVPTSITAYADGNYYIVDKFVVEGITRYYALDGAVNSAGSIIPTDITDAVTLNDGRITIDETNPVIKDAMKYNLAYINDEYVLTHLLSGKVIGKGQGEKDNNLSSADSHVNWYHFNANPNDPNTFSLNTTTVEDKEESHALFMQYSTWDSKKQVQVPLPRFRAYAVSNRGAQQEKNAFYSAGYTYFVPATPIALSNFATHEVSVSQYGSTTLCMPEDYVMPEGLTGKIVTAKENLATPGYYSLTIVTKYNAGDVVPAGECLVLSGEQDSYYIAPGEASSSASVTEYPDNLLRSDYVIDTEDSKLRFKTNYEEGNASSYYYYKLTTKNSANFGWYWGVDGGAPFWMTSNERTYLVIDKEIANKVRGFALDECNEEDITTFINGLVTEEINRSGRIYNLQGQMVNKLQKGINIVNGKKVIR